MNEMTAENEMAAEDQLKARLEARVGEKHYISTATALAHHLMDLGENPAIDIQLKERRPDLAKSVAALHPTHLMFEDESMISPLRRANITDGWNGCGTKIRVVISTKKDHGEYTEIARILFHAARYVEIVRLSPPKASDLEPIETPDGDLALV